MLSIEQAKNLLEHPFSFHSATATYQECRRRRFLSQFWDGWGLSPRRKAIELVTGGAVHVGVEFLCTVAKTAERVKITNWEPTIDSAVKAAHAAYKASITPYIEWIKAQGSKLFESEKYMYQEQFFLVEALVRLWAKRCLMPLIEHYNIVSVEREGSYTVGNVTYLYRIDAVLEDPTSRDWFAYSLKTMRGLMTNSGYQSGEEGIDLRKKKTNEHDSQGVAEVLALTRHLEDLKQNRKQILSLVDGAPWLDQTTQEKATALIAELYHQRIPTAPMGVLMLFLLKGNLYSRKAKVETEEDVRYTTTPLLRGYRRLVGAEWEFAHSDKSRKPENKSGFGKLGKGWEEFCVWETPGLKVKDWIDKLDEKVRDSNGQLWPTVQPELGDVLQNQIWTPMPYLRREEEVAGYQEQLASLEAEVFFEKLYPWSNENARKQFTDQQLLDRSFPQNRASCHYPSDCEYIKICHEGAGANPLEAGYCHRTPHHQPELVALQQVYNPKVQESEPGPELEKEAF